MLRPSQYAILGQDCISLSVHRSREDAIFSPEPLEPDVEWFGEIDDHFCVRDVGLFFSMILQCIVTCCRLPIAYTLSIDCKIIEGARSMEKDPHARSSTKKSCRPLFGCNRTSL